MSDPQFPVNVVQALIDSLLESTIIQSFITGLYTLLFVQAIVPLVRDGKKKIYAGALTLLYAMIVINLAASWQILRSVVVSNNATRDTMALQIFAGPLQIPRLANATGSIAILIADSLLVWRCYVCWQRSKIILGCFTLLILGEVALIPTYLTLNVALGPHQISIVCLYFLISVGITTIATSMIAFRIISISRRRQEHAKLTQIIVESGLLYSVTLLITGVLLAVQGSSLDNLGVVQAASYFGAFLTPVTGIAPTMTSYRITSVSALDEEQWSQPIFENSGRGWTKGVGMSDSQLASTINQTSSLKPETEKYEA